MLWMAIVAPVIGTGYMIYQIHKRDLRGWQHYACLTSLVFLISIMFLIAGGRIDSFGLTGNTVKLVDQKLDRIEALTEQNKRIARLSAELVISATSGLLGSPGHDTKAVEDRLRALLKEAGLSEGQIKDVLNNNTNRTRRLTIDSQ